MNITNLRALRGPNLWSKHTIIQCIVTCNEEEENISTFPGFESRLREIFPQLGKLTPSNQSENVSMAHVLEFIALGLQSSIGCPVTFSRTTATINSGVYQVAVEYCEEEVGRLAFEIAEKLYTAALEANTFDLKESLSSLQELYENIRLGPSTQSIVSAAIAKRIPYYRLTQGSLVQLGMGSKQKRIQAAETSHTSAIAESIVQDKEITKHLLEISGIPVPKGRPVRNEDEAWKVAQEIGTPVVVKTRDGNQGKGISVNLTNELDIRRAIKIASDFGDEFIVEKYLSGNDYRLLVIYNKLVAAARRDPPLVIGDGIHTISQLIDIVNSDPKRSKGHGTSLSEIFFDEIAISCIAEQGFTENSIPTKGVRVILRNNANLSTGGTATDVTDDVHPDITEMAILAAHVVGIDVCGIDIVCESILISLEDQNGGILEINAAPGLRMHLDPSYGNSRPVGEEIIKMMFPEKENGRIPIVAIAGTNGKTTTSRLIAKIMEKNNLRIGLTCSDGIYIKGNRIEEGDCSGPKSARRVLSHPDVDAAVFETARGGILREGLGFDECDVAVVTNIGIGDHLGLNYISTIEDLAVVKRVIVENVSKTGTSVLNASDPLVVKMATKSSGSVIFFSTDPNNLIISTHRAKGQKVVFQKGNAIWFMEGNKKHKIQLSNIPITNNGTFLFQIENVMAAASAGWALGYSWEQIENALLEFVSDAKTTPGRFNFFKYRESTIIADYGHNPDAINALIDAVKTIPAKRRIVVISAAGDRRDEDIREQARLLGDAFDVVVLYEDQCQRGRKDGEVLAILREGLINAKRTHVIEEIQGEFKAYEKGFSYIESADLCLILIDTIDEALLYIKNRIKESEKK